MKKTMYCFMMAILVASMVPSEATPTTPVPARIPFDQQQLPKFVVGQASHGGVAWAVVGGISTLISKYTPMKGTVTIIEGLKNTANLMREGAVDWTQLGSPSQPYLAYTGKWEGIEKLRIRTITGRSFNTAAVNGIWARKSSQILKAGDLKGKRIGIRAGLEWGNDVIHGIAAAHGWNENEYTIEILASAAAVRDAFAEGSIDAFVSSPGTTEAELHQTVGIRFLPMTEKETDAVLNINPVVGFPGMTPILPQVAITEPVWGLRTVPAWYCRADMLEKTTYTMLEVLFNHLDEVAKIHRTAKFELKGACDIVWAFPYHPGAVRYFMDKGVWTAAHTAKQKASLEKEKALFWSLLESDIEAFKELGILP